MTILAWLCRFNDIATTYPGYDVKYDQHGHGTSRTHTHYVWWSGDSKTEKVTYTALNTYYLPNF